MMLDVVRDKRAGFTLIEIMIVIAIIAILAGIVVPNFREARAEAQLAGCRQNILNIVKAIEMATVRCSYEEFCVKCGYNSYRGGEEVIEYLLENGYLSSSPRCPTFGSANYYHVTMNGETSERATRVLVICSDEYHTIVGGRIMPRYIFGNRDSGSFKGCGWSDVVE